MPYDELVLFEPPLYLADIGSVKHFSSSPYYHTSSWKESVLQKLSTYRNRVLVEAIVVQVNLGDLACTRICTHMIYNS